MATRRFFILALGFCILSLTAACNDAPDAVPNADQSTQNAELGCQGPEDCGADELCVATEGDGQRATCVAQCSVDEGDVCPEGEYCARVVGMSGDEAAACVPGSPKSHQSWQRCSAASECSDSESCVTLDNALGARCVPLCNAQDRCADASLSCSLHWDGVEGPQAGCAQTCETSADCERGWTCKHGTGLAGLCVR